MKKLYKKARIYEFIVSKKLGMPQVDETYLKVQGEWNYLYRAVDSNGNTVDFFLSKTRDKEAARKFFKKALGSNHNQVPRVITVDKNPSYEQVFRNSFIVEIFLIDLLSTDKVSE